MIDTAEKRSSAGGFWIFGTGPLPGGGMGQGDRQQVARIYRGIASRSPQTIFGLVSAFHPSGDPTKLVFEVHWGLTVPIVTADGALSEGAQNIEVNVSLNDAQITVELCAKLAQLMTETTGLLFLASDVRGCSV
jgi:hypothetical protein